MSGSNAIGNALHAFLNQIAAAIDAGDDAAACRRLDHFIAFVTKKSGRQIDAEAAAELIEMAEALAGSAYKRRSGGHLPFCRRRLKDRSFFAEVWPRWYEAQPYKRIREEALGG